MTADDPRNVPASSGAGVREQRWAEGVASVTPCTCGAQRARADAAEAEVERLRRGGAELGLTISPDESLLNWRGVNYVRQQDADAEQAELRESLDLWERLYREAVGVPASEHQQRRMDEVAAEWERAKAEAADLRREVERLRANRDAGIGIVERLEAEVEAVERGRDKAWAEVERLRRELAYVQQRWLAAAELVGASGAPRFDESGNFLGLTTGDPAAHRTVGPHRAWSDGGEWCYPSAPCADCGGQIDAADLRALIADHLDATGGEP